MSVELSSVKAGLAIIMLALFLNIGLGMSFGVNEDGYKNFVADGIAANPAVHDDKSADKIWRYAQRAHFHAGGVAAFCLGLIILVALSAMRTGSKAMAATLIGLGGIYPLSWFTMFLLAPSIGRDAAHEHILTKIFLMVGVLGILGGIIMLLGHLYLGLFRDRANA